MGRCKIWSLVNKTEKKKGGLKALKELDTKVETQCDKVADLAITGMVKVLNRKKVNFFNPMLNNL